MDTTCTLNLEGQVSHGTLAQGGHEHELISRR